VEAKSKGFRQAGFYLLEEPNGCFRGWMLLALLPAAWDLAKKQRGVLGREAGKKPNA